MPTVFPIRAGVSQAPLQLRPSERQTPGQNDLCGSERSSSDAAVLDMQSGSAARGIGSANGLASPARGSSSVDETSSFLQAAESLSLSDGFTKSPSRRTRNKGRRHSTVQLHTVFIAMALRENSGALQASRGLLDVRDDYSSSNLLPLWCCSPKRRSRVPGSRSRRVDNLLETRHLAESRRLASPRLAS